MRSHRLEAGNAGLPDNVTPTSASLLRWWFDRPPGQGPRFDDQQRRAILGTIVQHEKVVRKHRVAPPRHRLNLADDAGTTPVVLALLLWQLLNHTDTRATGRHDPRFTGHFVAITPHRIARDRLLDALWGRPLDDGDGARDFGTAELVRCADLFIPPARRDEVYAFLCGSACSGTFGPTTEDEAWIVIGSGRLQSPADLARLPHLMVFAQELPSADPGPESAATSARRQLRRVVSMHGKPCMEVVFSPTRERPAGPGTEA